MYQYATLGTNEPKTSKAFYDAVLGVLGIVLFYEDDHSLAYAKRGSERPSLWVMRPYAGGSATHGNGSMLCFDASSKDEVDAFHAAALAHHGSDEGAPGYREHYAPFFYAAYIRDPFGNKLATAFRDPARGAK
jgi:catechol 2,3-dioxygenase-like lactoylglutathione lyase family enzyme